MTANVKNINETTIEYDSRTIANRDMMLACLNDDAATAQQYRRIVKAEVLPAILAEEKQAYDDYATSHVITGTTPSHMAGHGSMSIGLDASKQSRVQMLTELAQAYTSAAAGKPVATVPISRSGSSTVRVWEIDGN